MNGVGRTYYGGLPVTDLGEIDAVRDLGELGGPPVGQVTDLGEIDPPVRDFGEIPPSPDEARGATTAQYWGSPAPAPPTAALPAPAGPPPSMASLRAGSSAMNAELAGAPPPKAGPTGDQAAAAAALAHYGGAPGPAKRSSGGGHVAPRGPSAYEKATGELRGTLEDDKLSTQRGASNEEQRANLLSSGASQIAQQKQDDQAIQQMEAANAAKHFADYSAETQRQVDDVRSKVIEPNRQYADTGSALMAILGGAMGGLYQGINKLSSNPFLDQMNKNIDRDIAVQEKNLATKKEGIGERKGLLAEMRATYKDEALAKLQARNLYYEGAKEALAAQAASYDSPAIQARADQAISALTREQAKLDIDEAKRKAAAAAAAGTAAAHRQQVDFENRLKLQHAMNETTTANANAVKATKEGDKDHRAAVQHVGDKLADVDKQGSAMDLESLHRYLIDPRTGQVDRSRSIPGVGRMADFRESIAPPLKGEASSIPLIVPRAAASAVLGLSPEERQNKNAYERSFLSFKNIKTGSASSEEEHRRLLSAWEGAKTTEEVAAAVDQAHSFLQRNRDSIRAEDPAATAEYEANLRAQTARDRSSTVKREAPK